MRTAVKTNSGIQEIDTEALAHLNRILFIEGEINQRSAMSFIKSLMYLQQMNAEEPVKVIINSPGGEIISGMLIYDAITVSEVPVKLYCFGAAYSMAAVIFAAGRHGRYILPHSKVMIHEPVIASGAGGKTSSVQTIAEEMVKTKNDMMRILSKHTGQSMKRLSQMTKVDTYFTADEAVAFGLADEVVDFNKVMEG